MNKLYLLSAVLLLCFLSTVHAKRFKPIKFDDDHDCLRNYQMDFEGNAFRLTGKSIYGVIFKKAVIFRHSYSSINVTDVPDSKKDNVTANFFTSDYRLYAIAEYEETNGVEGFQYDEDKLEGWYFFGSDSYKFTSNKTTFNTTLNNGTSVEFNAYDIVANSSNGMVSLRFTISDAPITIDSVDFNSETVKIDVEINNYFNESINKPSDDDCGKKRPFDCLSTGPSTNNNTRLALFTSFLVAGGTAEFQTRGLGGRFKMHGPIAPTFDFVAQAVVNGNQTIDIVTNKSSFNPKHIPSFYHLLDETFDDHTNFTGLLMVHSFDQVRPDSVFWDPSIGAENDDVSFATSDLRVHLPSFILISFIISFLLF
ncbi:hypothetical protein DFA_12200 [Cavenderia fasciculata]|uniref:Transmembrane protein n=1 Tax=Cavenderia fasciculata TaxID=261658 RepID=F4QCK0_CACFS|nr:uncharacterized protein DFA_12200 [Cavenderia fasciculata]EGG14428.1 hypothetical protein DFA_12200 [Cavenderia fasciculata]|eukprot:XP_004353837.1 hypothetical protein DFA_12200 [Cavenderia fasciculata]